jgi:mono/diheme cytochrome c family protein
MSNALEGLPPPRGADFAISGPQSGNDRAITTSDGARAATVCAAGATDARDRRVTMKARTLVTTIATIATLALASAAWAQDKAQIDKGIKVYADQKCSICHTIGGPANKMKSELGDVGTRLKAEQIRMWIVTPEKMKPTGTSPMKMKAYPALAKDDLDALVTYMLSLKK